MNEFITLDNGEVLCVFDVLQVITFEGKPAETEIFIVKDLIKSGLNIDELIYKLKLLNINWGCKEDTHFTEEDSEALYYEYTIDLSCEERHKLNREIKLKKLLKI